MSNDSEFICNVVQILATEPHPNADRLDLVTISLDGATIFPSKIVNSRGDFTPGDYAVYVGPDSVVPLSGPFEFLQSRLDAKGKTHYRVRSARIRGVYSPGLLIRVPDYGTEQQIFQGVVIGESYATALGVTNWSPKEFENSGSASTGSVPKLRAKDIFPVYSVTSLKKCPDLFKEGEPVVITEKIHGTNFRFGYGGRRRFYYGTHRTNLSDVRPWYTRLADYVRGIIPWLPRSNAVNRNPGYDNPWAQAVHDYDLKKICRDAPEYIFYGELFGCTENGKAIQKGFTYGSDRLNLQIFDVWFPAENRWLTLNEMRGVVWDLGLQTVLYCAIGVPYSFEQVKQIAESDSAFGGIREGVVIESFGWSLVNSEGERRKAKWVSERYHLTKDN